MFNKKVALVVLLITAASALSLYAAESFRYEPHGKRDPFVPLVGSDKPSVVRLEDVTSADDIKLEGIAVGSQGKKTAILNGEAVKEGDKVGDIELKMIGKNSITILIGGKPHQIYLPGEEGGAKGGE